MGKGQILSDVSQTVPFCPLLKATVRDGTRIYCFPTVACSRVEDLSPFYLTGGHESPAHLHCITGPIWCLSTLLSMGRKGCLLHPTYRLLVRHIHGSHAWTLLFTGGEALKMGLVRVPKEVCFSIVICLLMRTHGLGLLPGVSLSFHGILQMYSVDG